MKENKLIAEFEQLPTEVFKSGIMNYYRDGAWYEEHELSYEKDWNWLIPVVDKCWKSGAEENEVGDITHAYLDCDIEATYKAVVEFIKQLNKES